MQAHGEPARVGGELEPDERGRRRTRAQAAQERDRPDKAGAKYGVVGICEQAEQSGQQAKSGGAGSELGQFGELFDRGRAQAGLGRAQEPKEGDEPIVRAQGHEGPQRGGACAEFLREVERDGKGIGGERFAHGSEHGQALAPGGTVFGPLSLGQDPQDGVVRRRFGIAAGAVGEVQEGVRAQGPVLDLLEYGPKIGAPAALERRPARRRSAR